jgi:hypothetical protein
MNAIQALQLARAAGVRIGIEGETLTLEADAAPPSAVIDLLAQHKAQLLALLRTGSDGWSAEDWRGYFEERAAIREHDGGMSRADAEAGALADCVARWRALNPLPPSDDGACVQCGEARPDTPVLARGGHAWLHRQCWGAMNAARQREAEAAVRALLAEPEPS